MKRLVAIVVLTLTVVALVVPPAHAHGGAAASAALALGAFAAFNILFAPLDPREAYFPKRLTGTLYSFGLPGKDAVSRMGAGDE